MRRQSDRALAPQPLRHAPQRARAATGALATALGLAMGVTTGCGSGDGSGAPLAPPSGESPAATEPRATPPPGYPRTAAAGALADGSRWSLTETGLGEVCLRLTGPRTRGYACAELTSTWVVDALALKTPEGSLHIVFAGLPCGVADAELRRGDEPLDATPTTARDDVTYVVLETPGTLTGVELVALGRTGDELFRVDRLDDDPSSRIPTQGC